MTLEGAINFNETNLYTIYTMNSASAGQYCVVLPKNNNGMYNMLVDLHMKNLFDEVNSGTKTKDDLVNEISKEYNNVITKYKDAILVIPMIDEENYINIVNTNDKQKMFDEVKKIGAITSELYKKLINSGIEKNKIDQKIIIIEKNDYDKKFVEWLIGQMPNFVSGVGINEFTVVNDNPFMENPTPVDTNNIFGAPVVETPNAIPEVEQPTNQNLEVPNNPENVNIPNPAPVVEPVQEPIVEAQPQVPDIFGEQQVQPQPAVVETPPVDNTVQQPQPTTPVVEEPKPVQSVELDKTVTFSPVTENTNQEPAQPVQPVVAENQNPIQPDANTVTEEGQVAKKSNGFVNLAILLVILVGVTLVSIELGKFLYNTYGV